MSEAARKLARPLAGGKIAGVCAGIADYFNVDVTLVRLGWLVLSIIPGAVLGGILAYLAAWAVMPQAEPAAGSIPPTVKRLTRSATNRKIAGVCGGLAEYFGIDATAVRVLWIVLTIVPGAIFGGLIAYFIGWLIMPPVSMAAVSARPDSAAAARP